MRDFIMQMFAVQYAASLGDDVRTICNGVIETDSIASVTINRINTIAICEMTMTCWTPIQVDGTLYHCGECYACTERKKGFKDAGLKDKTKYYNERNV